MNLRNNFASHEEAFNDLTSLLIEIDTLNTAPASLSLAAADAAEFKQVAPVAQPAMSKEESEQRDNEPEFGKVNVQDEARPAVAPHLDPLPIQGLDPKIISDAYLELLSANQEKLKAALTYFCSDQFQISDENMSLVSRTCAHYRLLWEQQKHEDKIFRKNYYKVLIKEFNITSLLISVTVNNPDEDLIRLLLENGPPLNDGNKAMKRAIASCSPEIIALFVQSYLIYSPDALQSVRNELDQAVADSEKYPFNVLGIPADAAKAKANLLAVKIAAMLGEKPGLLKEEQNYFLILSAPVDAVKAKTNLLAAMIILEQQGHEFDYSAQDKTDFRRALTSQILSATTLSECLKIYEDNINASILAYKRNLLSKLSTSYTATKNELIKQAQARIVTLVSDIVRHQPEVARNMAIQALAHDAFSPAHIGRDIDDKLTKELSFIKTFGALHSQQQSNPIPGLDDEEEEQKNHQPPAQIQAATGSSFTQTARSKLSHFFADLRRPTAIQGNETEMQEMGNRLGQAPKPADNAADELESPRPSS
ncbi:MAG: hypothetical protein P4M14_12320 [Gammaproteobacteria bacterium]|nr:hypothetical protein [Gammaproteobacteria bacterium]